MPQRHDGDLTRENEIVVPPQLRQVARTSLSTTSRKLVGAGPGPLVPHGPARKMEAFRLLALTVLRLLEHERSRSLVVMSAGGREGRSSAVSGLARAIAEVSGPVVVVCADPARQSLDQMASDEVDALWRPGEKDGPPPIQVVDPWRLSGGVGILEMTHEFMGQAVASGATVLVDAPAVTESSVGFYLATAATGVLYVIRPKILQRRALHEEIRAQLDLLGVRVLGIVSNEW